MARLFACRLCAVRLSITTKIFLSLSAIILAFGGITLYGVFQRREIWVELSQVSASYLPLSKVVAQLEAIQQTRARETRRFIESGRGHNISELPLVSGRQYPETIVDRLAVAAEVSQRPSVRPGAEAGLLELRRRIAKLRGLYRSYLDQLERLEAAATKSGGGTLPTALTREVRQSERLIDTELAALARGLDAEVLDALQRVQEGERRAGLVVPVLVGLALLIALAVLLVVQRTLSPIRRLTQGAQAISRGDFSRRVEVQSRDELGILAHEFNEMAQALHDRDHLLSAQRAALLKAERLAVVGQMAAQVSHEIRNPLSSIGLNAELMADELEGAQFASPAQSAESQRLLQAIGREIERLTEITEEYLAFARPPTSARAPVEANLLAEDLAAFYAGELRGAQISLTLDLAPGLPPLLASEDQLRQALINLLRNAREAQPEGGEITLRTRLGPGHVEFCVDDAGPGVPPDQREQIFGAFFSTKPKGTGLGLSLCAQIASEHHGALLCEPGPGGGARFRLLIPVSDGAHSPPRR